MRYLLLCFFSYTIALTAMAQKKFTIDDVYDHKLFQQKSVRGINWMKDGANYSTLKDGVVGKYDVATGELVDSLFIAEGLLDGKKVSRYDLSADEKQLLIATEVSYVFRRSFVAEYYIYDIASKQIRPLSAHGKQSFATFSPNGKHVAFVRANDVFMVEIASMEEVQITDDGKANHIINGRGDWVYEEEFGLSKAFYWSPDSKYIAYYTFNESGVKMYNMQKWNSPQLYPKDYTFKYPKAGEDNAKVSISVFDVAKQEVGKDIIDSGEDGYIPTVCWTRQEGLLAVTCLNRLQNQLGIVHVSVDKKAEKDTVVTEKSETYIDFNYCNDLQYLEDGKHFIRTSEESGFKHLYLYTLDGKKARQITKGDWEMISFIGLDQSSKKPIAYYISTEESPLERHLYTINIETGKKEKLTKEAGVHHIDMSPDFSYYIDQYSNTSAPLIASLKKVRGNKVVKVQEDNEALKKEVEEYGLESKEMFTFKNDEGVSLSGYLLKPEMEEGKTYPVLIYVYGGPGSQLVRNEWVERHFSFHQALVKEGYIVACIDNRGTEGRGAEFKKSTYSRLGEQELADQVSLAKFLGSKSYIDSQRIGIWGWSYGGYMSSLAILLGNDVFKAAIAVAPVTSWRFYDTIYTERYLQRPQDNAKGYDDFSPLTHADKLKGSYLLVHGTGDDNVHFQNAVAMQDALIDAGKQFQSFYYPDRAHSIYGGNTRKHLYNMLFDFVKKNL